MARLTQHCGLDGVVCSAQEAEALDKFLKEDLDSALWEKLSSRLDFCNLDVNQTESFVRLAEMLKQDAQPAIHYFAMPPSTFGEPLA